MTELKQLPEVTPEFLEALGTAVADLRARIIFDEYPPEDGEDDEWADTVGKAVHLLDNWWCDATVRSIKSADYADQERRIASQL
jgi:hypothetical protein